MVQFSFSGKWLAYMDGNSVCLHLVLPYEDMSKPDYRFAIDAGKQILAVSDNGLVALFEAPETVTITDTQGSVVERITWEPLGLYDLTGVSAIFAPWPIEQISPLYYTKEIGKECLVLSLGNVLRPLSPEILAFSDGFSDYLAYLPEKRVVELYLGASVEISKNLGIVIAAEHDVVLLPWPEGVDIGIGLFSVPHVIGKITAKDELLAIWCRNGSVYVADFCKTSTKPIEIAHSVVDIAWSRDFLVLLHNQTPPLLSFKRWHSVLKLFDWAGNAARDDSWPVYLHGVARG